MCLHDNQDDLSISTGIVAELEVESVGQASARLRFMMTPLKGSGAPQTFVAPTDAPPQAFAAMTTILTAAYSAKLIVVVAYSPGDPPEATNVKLSSNSDAPQTRIGVV
jgi:hypothetical protein